MADSDSRPGSSPDDPRAFGLRLPPGLSRRLPSRGRPASTGVIMDHGPKEGDAAGAATGEAGRGAASSSGGVVVQVREKKGPLRAAIPYMPFPVAVICLFLNTFVPGLGKRPLPFRQPRGELAARSSLGGCTSACVRACKSARATDALRHGMGGCLRIWIRRLCSGGGGGGRSCESVFENGQVNSTSCIGMWLLHVRIAETFCLLLGWTSS